MAIVCQRCGNVQSSVHVTDISKGEKRERHLCAECAEEEGVVMKSSQVPLNEILSKFVTQKSTARELADLTCDHCGMTFVEFRSNGLLGCPHDYDAFHRGLDPLIERTHEGATQHVGKVPVRANAKVQHSVSLIRIKRELQQAIADEDYETAARLRDEIARLEPS